MSRTFNIGDEPVPGYVLVRYIGKGQFGQVWEAQTAGGIRHALKIIPQLDHSQGGKELKALEQLKNISHPNLAPVIAFWLLDAKGRVIDWRKRDAEPTGADTLAIAMGLGERNLFERLEECQKQGKPGIEPLSLLGFLDAAARGLDFLNGRHGIQHCDVKPHNILEIGGSAQVCDFGLAKVIGADVRKTSNFAGSMAYCAPEFSEGGPVKQSDQYALAVTYYELRTGKFPYAVPPDRLSIPNVLIAKIQGKLDLSAVTTPEAAVLNRALALKPEQRFDSCIRFITLLRKCFPDDEMSFVLPPRDAKTETPTRRVAKHAADSSPKPTSPPAPLVRPPSGRQPERAERPAVPPDDLGKTKMVSDWTPPPKPRPAPEARPTVADAPPPPKPPENKLVPPPEKRPPSSPEQKPVKPADKPAPSLAQTQLQPPPRTTPPSAETADARPSPPPQEKPFPPAPVPPQRETLRREDDRTLVVAQPRPPPPNETNIYNDGVQFTACHPRQIAAGPRYRLHAFARLAAEPSQASSARDGLTEIQPRVATAPSPSSEPSVTEAAVGKLPPSGFLSFVPYAHGVRFFPTHVTAPWNAPLTEAAFELWATGIVFGKTTPARVSVYGGGILIAEISFSLQVVDANEAENPQQGPAHTSEGRRFEKTFVSLAGNDSEAASCFDAYTQAKKNDFNARCVALRSGASASSNTQQLIQEADVFQLFWSARGMQSPALREEWEFAIRLNRPNFVRPVFWEFPRAENRAAELPPSNLARIHFDFVGAPRKESSVGPLFDSSLPAPQTSPTPSAESPTPKLSENRAAQTIDVARSPRPTAIAATPGRQLDETGNAPSPRTPSTPSKTWAPGDQPVPGYRLVRRIGRGSFGDVWEALGPGRVPVAMKLIADLDPQQGGSELRALQRVKQIRHPNIVPLFGFWVRSASGQLLDDDHLDRFWQAVSATEKKTPAAAPLQIAPTELYIVMGLGDMSLADSLAARRKGTGRGLPQAEVLRYLRSAAVAIDYLNTQGLQHCDVKPANILTLGGEAMLCDLGLAKAINRLKRSASSAGGTLAYGPHELFLRELGPSRQTDQFSLAVTYYELVTTSLPYQSSELGDVQKAKENDHFDLSRVTGEVRAVLRRALSKNPAHRFASALELIEHLERATRSEPSSPKPGVHDGQTLLAPAATVPSAPIRPTLQPLLPAARVKNAPITQAPAAPISPAKPPLRRSISRAAIAYVITLMLVGAASYVLVSNWNLILPHLKEWLPFDAWFPSGTPQS